MGCPSSGKSRKDIIKCLRKVPADDITNKEFGVASPSLNYSPFVTTIDYHKFINKEPEKLFMEQIENRSEKFDNGSVLIGVNKDEGTKALMYYLPRMFPNRELESNTMNEEMFDEAIFKIFYQSNLKKVAILTQNIRNHKPIK